MALTQWLRAVTVRGEALELRIVSDDQPELERAEELWRAVYRDEFRYLASEAPLDQRSTGALVIVAMAGSECVATLRMAYMQDSPDEFEFEFARLCGTDRVGTLGRLVLHPRFRRTSLALHMLSACHAFNDQSGNSARYEQILMSCRRELLHYYFAFGFALLVEHPVRHRKFAHDDTFVVRCTRETNARVAGEIDALLRGDWRAKVRWALRYQWCRARVALHALRLRWRGLGTESSTAVFARAR